jgi:hypothetical protein
LVCSPKIVEDKNIQKTFMQDLLSNNLGDENNSQQETNDYNTTDLKEKIIKDESKKSKKERG